MISIQLLFAVFVPQSIAITNTFQFTRSETICDVNPLKGFLTSPQWGIETDFPISLEFYYIPLRNVMINLTTYLWQTGLEPLLNASKGRSRHAIIRFYMDYPGRPTGVPQFLMDQGLQFNTYQDYEGGQSPDYTDPNLKSALLHFIDEFGVRYDGDPRIAVIQLGLLGFWGEWHTYPHEDWEWNESYADDIMKAWNNAFSATQLNIIALDTSVTYRFGYHDTNFAYATYDRIGTSDLDWFFYSELSHAGATQQWQSNMIGGEIELGLQSSLFTSSYIIGTYSQNWYLCVNLTHPSYMVNARAYEVGYNTTNGEYANALNAMRSLGYFIYLDYLRIDNMSSHQVHMDVNLINDGTPFYYDLKLIISLTNEAMGYQQIWDNNSLSSNTFGAQTNYVLSDILFAFDDHDLIHYFGNVTTGEFDAVFNLSFKLYSSIVYKDNPIRLCNIETDSTGDIGSIHVTNALYLNGKVPITSDTNDGMDWIRIILNEWTTIELIVGICIICGICCCCIPLCLCCIFMRCKKQRKVADTVVIRVKPRLCDAPCGLDGDLNSALQVPLPSERHENKVNVREDIDAYDEKKGGHKLDLHEQDSLLSDAMYLQQPTVDTTSKMDGNIPNEVQKEGVADDERTITDYIR